MPRGQLRQDQFLMSEYNAAVQLTFSVDELRAKLTSLLLTIDSAAAAAVVLLLQKKPLGLFGQSEAAVSIFIIFIALIGLIIVVVIARLRRVQLENFRIINNIRTYFLQQNYKLWNIVELSEKTLPVPNHGSGTYFWTLTIFLLNSYLIAVAFFLLIVKVWQIVGEPLGAFLSLGCLLLFTFVQDRVYFYFAWPPQNRQYSRGALP